MTLPQMSLAVVGAGFPNKRGPARRFEIVLCQPGEAIELVLEPKNPADPRAVAVFSCRGVQLGYLTAERCGRIGAMIRQGREVRTVFQQATKSGALIRAAFDGDEPLLPAPIADEPAADSPEFWPDEEWPDE